MKTTGIRELFPITKDWLYFDAASLAPASVLVKKAMNGFYGEYANFGSVKFDSWKENLEECRKIAAELIHANSDEVALLKNASEGINLVSLLVDWKKGDKVILFEEDFPANIYPFLNLRRRGVETVFLKNASEIEKAIDSGAKLLSISTVFYKDGYRVALEEIGKKCRENNVLFHVDATQSLGAFELNAKKCSIDFISCSGYKWLLSPPGTGIFYIREKLISELSTPVLGWLSVENGAELKKNYENYNLLASAKRFELGNQALPAFAGMLASLNLIKKIGAKNIEKHILKLSRLLVNELGEIERKGKKISLLTDFNDKNLSGIVSFTEKAKSKKITKEKLVKNKIIATVRDYVRLSPHIYNNEEDALKACQKIRALLR